MVVRRLLAKALEFAELGYDTSVIIIMALYLIAICNFISSRFQFFKNWNNKISGTGISFLRKCKMFC